MLVKRAGIRPYYYEGDWRPSSWVTKQVRYWIDADAFQYYSNVRIPAELQNLDEAVGLIAQLNVLEGVSCGSPNLNERHVRALLAVPTLNKLSVGKANLSPEFVRQVINDRQWEELVFSEIAFDDVLLADIQRQKELSRLCFDALTASAPALEGLANCSKLKFVDVHQCRCAGTIAKLARKLPNLRDIYVEDSSISATEMREFADVGGIRELHFCDCLIECPDSEILVNSPSLDWLTFYKSPISPAIVKGIANHPAMRNLILDGAFTDADAERLGNLPAVYELAFVSCDLTDEGLQHFAKAKTLKLLTLPKGTKCTVEGIRRLQAKLPVKVFVGDLGDGCMLGEATVYEPGGGIRKMGGK